MARFQGRAYLKGDCRVHEVVSDEYQDQSSAEAWMNRWRAKPEFHNGYIEEMVIVRRYGEAEAEPEKEPEKPCPRCGERPLDKRWGLCVPCFTSNA